MEATTGLTASPLGKLPLEIVLRITHLINTDTLCNFRLTCRDIERFIREYWIREFIYRKQFMIAQISLDGLVNLSKSQLGDDLRCVHFGLNYIFGAERIDESIPNAFEKYHEYWSQFTSPNLPYYHSRLVEAFRSLRNLETVAIRDFNSNRRTRDGDKYEWKSYGVKTILKETGIKVNIGHNDQQRTGDTFQLIFQALVEADARPQAIEVMLRTNQQMFDSAFRIPSYLNMDKVTPVLESLQRLHLCLAFADLHVHQSGSEAEISAIMQRDLRRFISLATNVRDLRINGNPSGQFGTRNLNRRIEDFFRWLAAPADDSVDGDKSMTGVDNQSTQAQRNNTSTTLGLLAPKLKNLDHLSIGHIKITGDCILDLVSVYASQLKKLDFWTVTLLCPRSEWEQDLNPKIRSPHTRLWQPFLRKLTTVPNLEFGDFTAGNMSQAWYDSNHQAHDEWRVRGPDETGANGRGRAIAVACSGSDWRDALLEHIKRMNANWEVERQAPMPYVPGFDIDDDSEDDDGEGDDDDDADDVEDEDEDEDEEGDGN